MTESHGFAAGLVGVVLDNRYRLDAVLGEGGMGAVFRAYHLAMERKVAVKLLKPHLTQDETALRRFAREARSTLKVDSPHAVKVLDFGVTPLNDYYMVLEYLDGRTVQQELDIDGPFAPSRVVHIARHALDALAAAHRLGLVHRDIKPDNLLLMRVGDDPDYAKVLDFGVAKLMQGSALAPKSALSLTQAGMVFGTPEFMSPEQACGHALDARSDLYSLAATMFAMLTGCGLFTGKSAIEWLTHHARTPPPHLESFVPELHAYPELDAVLQRCLAKHREDRPRDAGEMAKLLAMIEPTVRAGGRVSPKAAPGARTMFSASAYSEALPEDTLEPARQQPMPTAETTRSPSRRRRRSGLLLALGAIAVIGVIAAAVVIAIRKHAGAPHEDAAVVMPAGDAAVGLDATPDAAPEDAAMADVAPIDAPADAAVHVPHPRDARHDDPHAKEAEEHVRLAEEARAGGHPLNQLGEADLALKADPRNVRARFLLGDAQIERGDHERGCRSLRACGRYPPAIDRATAAGCPP